jgi:hypothetical protein
MGIGAASVAVPGIALGRNGAMTKAIDVLRDIKASLETTDGEIRRHRNTAALAAGEVPLAALQAFPGHQYHM